MRYIFKKEFFENEFEFNEELKAAFDLMERTHENIFITGNAGTGKSTLLDYFRYKTQKNIVVLAPTGVAALNVKGQTIHSFFGFSPSITVNRVHKMRKELVRKKVFKKVEVLVIDEISMVRADLLDCVDMALRIAKGNKHIAFGGIQVIFVGDLYQLPPVLTQEDKTYFNQFYESPYFFDSNVFVHFDMKIIQLTKIYRQKENDFISVLNKVRNDSATFEDIKFLNRRYEKSFSIDENFIVLTTTNKSAKKINDEHIESLESDLFTHEGKLEGDFDISHLPTEIDLSLKIGSQIMMLNNDSKMRWVNGSLGKITDIQKSPLHSGKDLVVELNNGRLARVAPNKWEISKYFFNEEEGEMDVEIIGSFEQYPVRLAWAITIHKSQGKTFDKVVLDLGTGAFCHGQVYVALSRCKTLEGLILKKPLKKKDLKMDFRIIHFLTKFQYQLSEKNLPLEEKIDKIQTAIDEQSSIHFEYLRSNDEKHFLEIKPLKVGRMEYQGHSFIGFKGYCIDWDQNRTFRVDRVLNIGEDN